MEDDIEDGEIRPDSDSNLNSGQAGNEESPRVEQGSPRSLERSMHEVHGKQQSADGIPKTINVDVGPATTVDQANNIINNLDNTKDPKASGVRQEPMSSGPFTGPTPVALRKRTRDTRSPASSDSTNGPPIRPFCHRIDEEGHPIDLNSPCIPNGAAVDASVGPITESQVGQQDFHVTPPATGKSN
ncbi:hypothetical protein Hanom_Chr12g01085131 [Helianthus anomalus]